jgi:hypothetical protein
MISIFQVTSFEITKGKSGTVLPVSEPGVE